METEAVGLGHVTSSLGRYAGGSCPIAGGGDTSGRRAQKAWSTMHRLFKGWVMGRSIYVCRMSEESKWFLEDFNRYKYGSEVNLEKWVEFPFGWASVYLTFATWLLHCSLWPWLETQLHNRLLVHLGHVGKNNMTALIFRHWFLCSRTGSTGGGRRSLGTALSGHVACENRCLIIAFMCNSCGELSEALVVSGYFRWRKLVRGFIIAALWKLGPCNYGDGSFRSHAVRPGLPRAVHTLCAAQCALVPRIWAAVPPNTVLGLRGPDVLSVHNLCTAASRARVARWHFCLPAPNVSEDRL